MNSLKIFVLLSLFACMTMSVNTINDSPLFLEEKAITPVIEQGASDIVGCVMYASPLVQDVFNAVQAANARNSQGVKNAVAAFAKHFDDFQKGCLDKLA